MSSTVKSALKNIAKIAVGAVAVYGGWTAGYFIDGDIDKWKAVALVAAVIYGFFVVANTVFALIFKFSTQKINAEKAQHFGGKLIEKIQADYGKARRNVKAVLVSAYLYIAIMILCVMLVAAAAANLLDNIRTSLCATLCLTVFTYPFVDVFFRIKDVPAPPFGSEIVPSAFPMLHETARAAANALGCPMPVRLFCAGDGVSVSVYGGSVIICVDCLYAALLTRKELYNVFLHEVAHVINRDSARGRLYARAEAMFSGGSDNFSQELTIFTTVIPAITVTFAINVYDTAASRHHEIEADAVVLKTGDKQAYVDALAKSRLIALFRNMPRRELDYDFYASEDPTCDYAAQELALYPEYLETYENKWLSVLEREIPARVDSHPTFKMRREAFGCDCYDTGSVEPDENYRAEQAKTVAFTDTVLRLQNLPYYASMRENNYVSVKKEIDLYEQASAAGDAITERQKLAAMRAYYGIDNAKAAAIADEITEELPSAPTANLVKGMILFFQFDDGCIECFKLAGKAAKYADTALDLIGKYYLLTGKQDEIERYRENSAKLAQAAYDAERGAAITRKTKLVAANIDERTADELIEYIRKETHFKVSKIYIAKYTDFVNNDHYPVLLVFNTVNTNITIGELPAAFNAIGTFSDKYDFIPCYGKNPLNGKIIKAPNSLYFDAHAKLRRD